MKKGPFTVLNSKTVYKNDWIEVIEDEVIDAKGKPGLFGVIHYKSGVSVVALNAEREIYLIKEYNYALDNYNYKLPSGGIDAGETPLDGAKRELEEETGLIANNW